MKGYRAHIISFVLGFALCSVLAVQCGPSNADIRDAQVQVALAQDSLARVSEAMQAARDSLSTERARERDVRIVYRERRVEAERETVEAGESLQASITSLREAQPELADSLQVQVGRLEDGYRLQLAHADSSIASLERELTLAEAEALTYKNERDAERMAREYDRRLIELLEKERGWNLPFGIQVPHWVGYVGAGVVGYCIADGCL